VALVEVPLHALEVSATDLVVLLKSGVVAIELISRRGILAVIKGSLKDQNLSLELLHRFLDV
jgi:hypothetical protein